MIPTGISQDKILSWEIPAYHVGYWKISMGFFNREMLR